MIQTPMRDETVPTVCWLNQLQFESIEKTANGNHIRCCQINVTVKFPPKAKNVEE